MDTEGPADLEFTKNQKGKYEDFDGNEITPPGTPVQAKDENGDLAFRYGHEKREVEK